MADVPEADCWRAILDRHGSALVLFARQWSESGADAEDAVQEGFLRSWRTRGRARDPVAYLYACVRSAATDVGRSQRRRRRREQAARRPEAFAFDAERADRNAAIEAALMRLPAEQREVVVLKIWAGLTFAQIAEALMIPPDTAASRYRYALRKLEAKLSEVAHG